MNTVAKAAVFTAYCALGAGAQELAACWLIRGQVSCLLLQYGGLERHSLLIVTRFTFQIQRQKASRAGAGYGCSQPHPECEQWLPELEHASGRRDLGQGVAACAWAATPLTLEGDRSWCLSNEFARKWHAVHSSDACAGQAPRGQAGRMPGRCRQALAVQLLAVLFAVSVLKAAAEDSQLWGRNGEKWRPNSRIVDHSYAGYGGGKTICAAGFMQCHAFGILGPPRAFPLHMWGTGCRVSAAVNAPKVAGCALTPEMLTRLANNGQRCSFCFG